MGRDPDFRRKAGMANAVDPSRGTVRRATKRFLVHGWNVLRADLSGVGRQARGQAPTVDTSVPGMPGASGSMLGTRPARGIRCWGRRRGLAAVRSPTLPGARAILGGRPGPQAPKGIPTVAHDAGRRSGTDGPAACRSRRRSPQPVSPTTVPLLRDAWTSPRRDQDDARPTA